MPKAILKVALTVGLIYATAGLAAAAAVSVGAVSAIATIAQVANALAISAALSGIARALSPKPRTPGSPGVQTEYAGTLEARRIIYGKVRVSGMNVIPPVTSGTDNENLHQVLAIAGHECTGIDAYYANKTAVTPGAISGTANDGKVTSGTWANVLWLRGYLGTSTQTADYILTQDLSSSWTSNHRGRGMCYVAAKFQASDTAYQNGKPDLTFDVRGRKCYDPRLDTSPGANPTNASYIAYTTNPALCLADYLMNTSFGRKVPASRIDWALCVAAANICDETISGGDAPPTGSQKRYTCNVVLSTGDDPDENCAVIASAMLGLCYRSGGVWRMYAGAWSSSAFSLTADDVIGVVRVASETPRREKWNSVRGSILDAARSYQQVEFPPRVSASYISTDGQQLWKEVQFPACTDIYEAQRNAILLLRQSRNRRSAQVECSLAAWKVRVNETGTITIDELGWSNQTVRCTAWQFSQDGTVTLTLREEYSTDWTNPVTADYTTPGSVSTPVAGYTRPGTPVSFTATAINGGIEFVIGTTDPTIPGQKYRIYENTSGQPFSTATKVWEGTSSRTTLLKTDTTTRDYWVTAAFGANESAPRPTGSGTAAAALPSTFSAWGLTLTGMQQTGLTLEKISGGSDWNAQAYSNQGFSSGLYVSARPLQTNGAIMFGLNSDPSTNASYTSIDYAWYLEADGTLSIYENGASVLALGAYSTGTVLTVTWNGGTVRYYQNNVLRREVAARATLMYFDSSFYHVGAELTDLTIVPIGAVGGNNARGAALNRDPDFLDASAWDEVGVGALASSYFVSVSDGKSGNRVFRSATGDEIRIQSVEEIPVDPNKTYRIGCWVRRGSTSTSGFYLAVALQEDDGTNIVGDGTYWNYDAAENITPTTTWTWYETVFGFGTSRTFPSGARTMRPLLILNYTGTTGYQEVQGVRIEEAAPTSLIAPGAATYAASVFDAGPIDFSNIA